MEYVSYKKGYKYQIVEQYQEDIDIRQPQEIDTDYIDLTVEGRLTLKAGYAWDGPSGPTFDTRNFMRGSLVHDALYQLMREEHLDKDTWRKPADQLLRLMCRQDGMWWLRAWWVYVAVRKWADPAADPSNKKSVIKAPKQ